MKNNYGDEKKSTIAEGKDSIHNSSTIPSWANIDFSDIDVGERIGGGGVGIIYKGWWKNQPVALKTLFDTRISLDLKQEYLDELLVMSKVKHSNIVSFLGACMTPPNLCFVMELCDCSLFQLLHVEKSVFSPYQSIQMAIDIASAMEYLHSLTPSIIHRDLKSLNVLKSSNGCLKLCDFGLVKVKNVGAGTPQYMAPELMENKPFSKSVDVYAFGMLLWEIHSSEIPFMNISVSDIRNRVINGIRPRLPLGIHPICSTLISTCWEGFPENRPSFTQIVDDLLRLADIIPITTHMENVKDSVGDALDGLIGKK